MTRKAPIQLPLRRAYFLQQPLFMRSLICGLMYFEDGYNIPQQAKYLGLGRSTVHRCLHLFLDIECDAVDYEIARSIINTMRSLLYATHW